MGRREHSEYPTEYLGSCAVKLTQVSEQLKEAGLGWLLDFEHAHQQSQKQKRSEAQEEVPNHIASPEKMETLIVSEQHDLDLGHPLLSTFFTYSIQECVTALCKKMVM